MKFGNLVVVLLAAGVLSAQVPVNAGYGGFDDAASAPGSPASSYALGGVDHVNFYSGSVNVAIPILTIGGRGNVTRPITIPIQEQYEAINFYGMTFVERPEAPGLTGAYTSGYISTQQFTGNTYCGYVDSSGQQNSKVTGPYSTFIIWTGADGTQTVLKDAKYGGQPQGVNVTDCSQALAYQGTDLGKVFKSADGSGLTFVADNDVIDNQNTQLIYGTLITRDGTRYRFSMGAYPSTIEDRNGNTISFNFSSTVNGGIYTITDPAGRQPTINFTEDVYSDAQDVITYGGFGNNQHKISVNYAPLQNTLAPNETMQSMHCLFPEAYDSSNDQVDTYQYVISSIVLADSRSYSMYYNSYGELVKLVLPTGGYYTYQYPEANCNANGASGLIALSDGSGFRLDRRLLERDEYADGQNLSGKVVFPAPTPYTSGIDPNHPSRPGLLVEADYQKPDGTLLRKEMHYFYGNPLSNVPLPSDSSTHQGNWWQGIEFKTEIFDSSKMWQRQERIWTQMPCGNGENCWFTPTDDSAPPHNPQMCQSNTTLDNGLNAATLLNYDSYNNVTDRYEYGYGVGPVTAAACSAAPSGYTRHTFYSFRTDSPYVDPNVNLISLPFETKVLNASGQTAAYSYNEYDQHSPQDTSGIVGHDTNYGTSFNARGNITTHHDLLYTPAYADLKTTFTYDIAGNLLSQTDANNHTTSYSYTDSYSDMQNRNTFAHATKITNALNQSVTAAYDYNTGQQTSATDLNNVTTQYDHESASNSLDRLIRIHRAAGVSGVETQTNFVYHSPTWITQYQDQSATGDQHLETDTYFDGLGRATQTQTKEDSGTITATTTYDALGRVYQTTNPSRNSTDATNGTTTYGYDALGRTTSTAAADGSLAQMSYTGNQVVSTDQNGLGKRMTYDALGRLLSVVEDPGGSKYKTTYGYDALDDLICVNQGYSDSHDDSCALQGAPQTRQFVYDELGRLHTATNPESGTTTYAYDAVGNLQTQTDARSISVTYEYDALNRLRHQYSSDGSDASHGSVGAYYYYGDTDDAAKHIPNALGRLTTVFTQSSQPASTTSITAYDALGQVKSSSQTTNGYTYSFAYSYNLAGALTSETYPSGRTFTTGYDGTNRPNALSGSFGGQLTNYVHDVSYAAHGIPAKLSYANQLVHTTQFNNRLQSTDLWDRFNDSTSSYVFQRHLGWVTPGSNNNNGSLRSADTYQGGPDVLGNLFHFSQQFSYDNVNRLTQVSQDAWNQTYSYDAYGNLAVATSSGVSWNGITPNVASDYNAANNRLISPQYDPAGNQKSIGAVALTYDAENRQVQSQDGPNVAITYTYDGQGQRVLKSGTGLTTSVYVYDIFGQLAAEYTGAAPARPPYHTLYLSYDQVGSLRVVTNENQQVISQHDYLPFGAEIPSGQAGRPAAFGANDGLRQRFTGQERDSETTPNLDYFQARYFSAEQARFLSPDPANAGADPLNPQSWNMYAYVLNNPLSNNDPSGRSCLQADDGSYVDDGDGLGCGAAGVGAGNPNDPGTLNQGQINAWATMDITQTPTLQDNYDFYQLWASGSGPQTINYGPNDGMTKQLANSDVFNSIRAWYLSNGCSITKPIGSTHYAPAIEGFLRLNMALIQVGGFSVSAQTSGNTTAFTITNVAGQASFSGATATSESFMQTARAASWVFPPALLARPLTDDGVKDNPYGLNGPRHNITQTFQWTESNVCQNQ